jgi:serine protease Do
VVNSATIASPVLLSPGDTVKLGAVTLVYEGLDREEVAPPAKLEYDQLFEQVKRGVVSVRRDEGLGSGVFVHGSGLIVTNRHVVGYEHEVGVQTFDAGAFTGHVVRAFPDIDLAFVQVEGVTPLLPPFAQPATVRVGQTVLVIGHRLGLANSLSRGIISAIDREVMGNAYLQTDAAINPGNSGGPLFNEHGEIVGIATFSIGRGQGLSFAVPAERVRERLARVRAEQSRVREGHGHYCHVCGMFSPGGAYCPGCGVSLGSSSAPQTTPRCANCGKTLTPGDLFCSGCGTKV